MMLCHTRQISMFIDHHVHFTGALPGSYLATIIKQKDVRQLGPWLRIVKARLHQKTTVTTPEALIGDLFSDDYQHNLKIFPEIYDEIRLITKPELQNLSEEDIYSFYYEQTYTIANNLFQHGISKVVLIAGSKHSEAATKIRLRAMTQALLKLEQDTGNKFQGWIRLALIRDASGAVTNLPNGCFDTLCQLLYDNHALSVKIYGFDFCGWESTSFPEANSDLIHALNSYRVQHGQKYDSKLLLSCHAGENLVDISSEAHLEIFDWMLTQQIDIVAHGTFLWLPNEYLHLTNHQDQARKKILRALANQDITLEICPTANLLLTPLEALDHIPFTLFEDWGVNYSINSDNPTLFATNVCQELSKVASSTHKRIPSI